MMLAPSWLACTQTPELDFDDAPADVYVAEDGTLFAWTDDLDLWRQDGGSWTSLGQVEPLDDALRSRLVLVGSSLFLQQHDKAGVAEGLWGQVDPDTLGVALDSTLAGQGRITGDLFGRLPVDGDGGVWFIQDFDEDGDAVDHWCRLASGASEPECTRVPGVDWEMSTTLVEDGAGGVIASGNLAFYRLDAARPALLTSWETADYCGEFEWRVSCPVPAPSGGLTLWAVGDTSLLGPESYVWPVAADGTVTEEFDVDFEDGSDWYDNDCEGWNLAADASERIYVSRRHGSEDRRFDLHEVEFAVATALQEDVGRMVSSWPHPVRFEGADGIYTVGD